MNFISKMTIRRRLYIILAVAFMCPWPAAAEEESADSVRTYSIDEAVIISSTKETNDLRTLPAAASKFSPQAVENNQIYGLKDLSAIVPNVFIPDYGSKMTSAIYIRGIGARSGSQSIGLYVDNVPYLDKSTFDFELTDIRRIEVLRGPQGTLYGRNAMGGIVNIHTLSPLSYQGTRLSLSVGNYWSVKAKAAHYMKIGKNAGIALSGYYDRHNGYFTNEYDGSEVDREQSAGGRFKLDWNIRPNLELRYAFSYDFVDQGAYPYRLYDAETGTTSPICFNDPSSYRRNSLNTSLYIGWSTEKFLLSSTTAYQHLSDDMKMDQDYSEQSIFTLGQKQKEFSWSEEIAIKSNTSSNYQWSFGVYGFYNSLETDGPVTFKEDGISSILQPVFDNMVAGNPYAPTLTVTGSEDGSIYFPGNYDTPTYGVAVFHQSTYNDLFTEGLSLTAGIRLDYEKTKLDYYSAVEDMSIGVSMGPMQTSIPVTTTMEGDLAQDFWQVLPKVSLCYRCSPRTFSYISVSKGYKTGGYNVQMFADLIQAQAQYEMMSQFAPSAAVEPESVSKSVSYKPEHSWNYEFGMRSEVVKDRLNVDMAVFYMDIRNIQLTAFTESGTGRLITNAGRAGSYGVELSAHWNVAKGLTADLNYGYTHATFRSYIYSEKDDDSQVVETDCKGNFVPYTPRHTLNIGLNYSTLLRRNRVIDRFFASAQLSGTGKIYWTELNEISQPFYCTLNAKAGVQKGIVSLNVWARNITCTDYQAFYFESRGNSFIQKGKPFRIGAEIIVNF